VAERTTGSRTRRPELKTAKRVAGIVLAAGQSSRMGKPKLLLPWEGAPLLEHVIQTLLHSQVEDIWVVISRERPFSTPPAERPDIHFVYTADPGGGLSHSLQTGLSAIPDSFDAAAIVLADQPGLQPDLVDRVIREALRSPAQSARPVFKQGGRSVPGHPFVLMRNAFSRAAELTADQGARVLFNHDPEALREFEVNGLAPPDVDTPEDYSALLKTRRNASALPLGRIEDSGPNSS
jgi:molybdenum cofactor cytidylyltransferase